MATPNIGFAVFNGMWPQHVQVGGKNDIWGPKALNLQLSFAAGGVASQEINLFEEETMNSLQWVQCLYIDNADNAAVLNVVVQMTGQRVRVKQNTQGYYPVFAPPTSRFVVSTTLAGTLIVPITFLNMPMPAFQWPTV